jgi:hypothetical protein
MDKDYRKNFKYSKRAKPEYGYQRAAGHQPDMPHDEHGEGWDSEPSRQFKHGGYSKKPDKQIAAMHDGQSASWDYDPNRTLESDGYGYSKDPKKQDALAHDAHGADWGVSAAPQQNDSYLKNYKAQADRDDDGRTSSARPTHTQNKQNKSNGAVIFLRFLGILLCVGVPILFIVLVVTGVTGSLILTALPFPLILGIVMFVIAASVSQAARRKNTSKPGDAKLDVNTGRVCPYCRNINQKNDAFCRKCGKRIQ